MTGLAAAACPGHPRRGQLARQERVALILALLDFAIPASKADLDHFFVLQSSTRSAF